MRVTTRDASCHALKSDCGFDAGLLRNMRICVRDCNGGCGSSAGLPRNLRICRLRGAACVLKKTANPMRGYLEICGSVCRVAMPAADSMQCCLEVCGSTSSKPCQ